MLNDNRMYLSIEQISQYCNVGKMQVERWITKGLLVPSSNKKNVPLEDFIKFLNYMKLQPEECLIDDSLRVLVIEDEIDVADIIGNIFYNNGFQVMKSQNAIEASCLIQYETPQIVTIDLGLGTHRFNGKDILKNIPRLKLEGKVWVIVISASDQDVLNESVSLGADCYLQKPFAQEDLEKLINKFFPSPQLRRPYSKAS